MSRLIIVIMEENQYPFGQCDNSMLEKKKVMVRRRIQFHPFQKKNMLLKAKKLKGFINPYLIKLEQLLQEDTSLHLLFEYVPIKIETWISNINSEFIENFRLQLFELADYLAENSILIDFRLKNIGMDQNYLPKYFIGLDYEINTLTGKDLLLEKYKTQINEIINPYRTKFFDEKKIKLAPQPNPEFACEQKQQTFKRENQKSVKQIILTKTPVRPVQTQKTPKFQRDSIKKTTNLSEYDLKLTFDGSQKVLFENLPKNISTSIKIEHIGKKINELKNKIQNLNGKNVEKKHESTSLSPMKDLNEQRLTSSHQKDLGKQATQTHPKMKKVEKNSMIGGQSEKLINKDLRETQSESEYSGKNTIFHGLDRINEKTYINQSRTKNEVRVIGANKQSYIDEFERLLNDDIDQFAAKEVTDEPKKSDDLQHHQKFGFGQIEQKSPRFGFDSGPIEIENIKTEPERYSYSHTVKRRKKSTESASSRTSEIQERVNAAIGLSKKLISNFKKGKVTEKKQFVPKLQ